MLTHPTLDQLDRLQLKGMAEALQEQLNTDQIEQLSFDERFGLLVDREAAERDRRRLKTRLSKAKLRHDACIEDIDFRTRRGLDKKVILDLASCEWVDKHRNVLICGPTGVGKSFLACALAHKACREGHSVRYARTSRLLDELALARADGSLPRVMTRLASTHVLVPRRFWSRTADRSPAARPARNCRRPTRPEIHHHHRPATSQHLGTKRSATPPSPMPSLTASSTAPTTSTSKENPCEKRTPHETKPDTQPDNPSHQRRYAQTPNPGVRHRS